MSTGRRWDQQRDRFARTMRRAALLSLVLSFLLTGLFGRLEGQQTGVISTLHNLSVTGPGQIRSATETRVCKFCHIPHSAVVPTPLWGHALSQVQGYDMPQRWSADGTPVSPSQPDGSSRLCLSCHDGTVALGDVAGESQPITMVGSQRLLPGSTGHLGTDLSGSHPISFVVVNDVPGAATAKDMGVRPLATILGDPDVRLDSQGKMQCTSCHDPHSDRYYQPGQVPHFWVKASVEEVCLTCHELR